MSKDAVESAIDNLATYLAAQVSGLTVLKEWPAANQKLTYPSVTIFSNEPEYMNLQPYEIARTAPDVDNHTTSTLVVGEWDTQLQLDLWCRNKQERRDIGKAVKDALNKKVEPQGLSLQLSDYFNEWARFDMVGYQIVDDEAGSQRQEYRTKISLRLNVKEVSQLQNYAMITFDTQVSTPDNISG